MRLTPKRTFAIAGAIATLISFSRISVLFLEALSTVRDERLQDSELLEACANGIARGSNKMRAACLQAQADRASPIVLKAVLRAFTTAYSDFTESVSSPTKLLLVILFATSSVFLPVLSWLRAVLPTERPFEGSPHVVVLANDAGCRSSSVGFKQRVRGALRLRKGSVVDTPPYELEESGFLLDTSERVKWE